VQECAEIICPSDLKVIICANVILFYFQVFEPHTPWRIKTYTLLCFLCHYKILGLLYGWVFNAISAFDQAYRQKNADSVIYP
jgi:hypothetical protein